MSETQKPKTRNRGPKYGPRVLVGGHFHPDVQKQLREIAADNGKSVQALLIEGLNHVFSKYGKPRIAGVMPEPNPLVEQLMAATRASQKVIRIQST